MKTESFTRVLAGTFVLIGTALGYFVHEAWLLLPVFVGFNLIQSSFTGFCPAAMLLGKGSCMTSGGCTIGSGRDRAKE